MWLPRLSGSGARLNPRLPSFPALHGRQSVSLAVVTSSLPMDPRTHTLPRTARLGDTRRFTYDGVDELEGYRLGMYSIACFWMANIYW